MKTLKQQYENARPIGAYTMCNFGGLVILDIIDGGETAVAAWHYGDGLRGVRRHKIAHTYTGRAYIRKGGARFYFDQITRLGGAH